MENCGQKLTHCNVLRPLLASIYLREIKLMLGILNYLFGNQQALQTQRNIEDKVSKLTADALIQSNDQQMKREREAQDAEMRAKHGLGK